MSTKALSGVAILSAGLMLAGAGLGAQDAAQPGAAARKLELKFNDGLVTLRAQNVTVREVLAEWARLCDCQVIGAEKITNTTLAFPVQYVNQPEAVIMKSLLNPGIVPGSVTGGYVFVPRGPGETGASAYASIRIAPVSHPTAVSYSQMPSSPVAAPLISNDTSDELPPVVNIPLQDPGKTQQAPAAPPVAPVVPPSVMPTTGVNPGVGRTGGPGLPTAPPTVPPTGTGTGRGGGGGGL
jgi:hypothetical protein